MLKPLAILIPQFHSKKFRALNRKSYSAVFRECGFFCFLLTGFFPKSMSCYIVVGLTLPLTFKKVNRLRSKIDFGVLPEAKSKEEKNRQKRNEKKDRKERKNER
jgi:hypothetical protein